MIGVYQKMIDVFQFKLLALKARDKMKRDWEGACQVRR
ncbi:hypothetical protein BC777_1523 [Yoonia maricola]|uniref:Uncharacterized protein n=1 Tax=Yoonia maricola TaxID=420999 RepID=A0A2M8WP24_9RHOB|nr:hypothetical protein BC777_1523 [Yoonia maricola]